MLERIQKLCLSNNISLAQLERDLEFPRSSMRKWKISTPSVEKAQKVADYFGVTIDYLVGATDDPHSYAEITEEEKAFFEMYERAQASDKETVKSMLKIINKLLGVDEEDLS